MDRSLANNKRILRCVDKLYIVLHCAVLIQPITFFHPLFGNVINRRITGLFNFPARDIFSNLVIITRAMENLYQIRVFFSIF